MLKKYDEDFIEYLPQIRHAANKVANKFGDVFVIDELVNEAWIRGRNSNRPNKSQFVQRATWDMKDYIRSIFGRTDYSYKGKKIETEKRPQFFTNYDSPADSEKVKHRSVGSIFDIPVENKDLFNLENKEIIELILSKTSTKRAIAMINYYLEENNLVETGLLMGHSEGTISNLLKGAKAECYAVATGIGFESWNVLNE